MIQFAKEPLTDALWDEAMPLLRAHWKEVAAFQDIPLNPDRALYAASEEAGILRVFTARDASGGSYDTQPVIRKEYPGWRPLESWPLVGYALYFVRPAPHYQSSVQAVQDVLYLHPDRRGRTAYKFVAWCDEQLSIEGVQVSYHHVKASKDFGSMLEHQGYELVDRIYAKRLDRVPYRYEPKTALPDVKWRDPNVPADTKPEMGQDWREQAQHDYDTARFVGQKP